jgi:fucose permease
VAGAILLGAFWRYELRAETPLVDVRNLIANRVFAVDNAIMLLFFTVWLAIFVFGSMYFQIAAGQPPSQAGFSILTVFYPFFVTSRIGGAMMDRGGPRLPVSLGLLATTVGMALWAGEATGLDHIDVLPGQLVTGGGLGLVMSAINTDALNRVAARARGEASGVVQTVRNFGSALGVAVLGTVLLSVWKSNTESSLQDAGVPGNQAHDIADSVVQGGSTSPSSGSGGGRIAQTIGETIAGDFAQAFQAALYVGAGIMAVAFVLAVARLPSGRQAAVE